MTVRTKFPMIVYDFTSLDEVVQLLYTHKLRIGFELMGNPSNHFTDFEDSRQIRQWYKLIYQVKGKGRFGNNTHRHKARHVFCYTIVWQGKISLSPMVT